MTSEEFSWGLKNLRKSKLLSQKDVAKAMGISSQSYGQYESGRHWPKMVTIIRLANFFGMSKEAFMCEVARKNVNVPENEVGVEEEVKEVRTRNETAFRSALSKDGTYSPKIGKETAARLVSYCETTNQSKVTVVERCINETLDRLEVEYLNSLSKDELIAMLRNR